MLKIIDIKVLFGLILEPKGENYDKKTDNVSYYLFIIFFLC